MSFETTSRPPVQSGACLLYTSSPVPSEDTTAPDSAPVDGEDLNALLAAMDPVSYTHLDVYKRQLHQCYGDPQG